MQFVVDFHFRSRSEFYGSMSDRHVIYLLYFRLASLLPLGTLNIRASVRIFDCDLDPQIGIRAREAFLKSKD